MSSKQLNLKRTADFFLSIHVGWICQKVEHFMKRSKKLLRGECRLLNLSVFRRRETSWLSPCWTSKVSIRYPLARSGFMGIRSCLTTELLGPFSQVPFDVWECLNFIDSTADIFTGWLFRGAFDPKVLLNVPGIAQTVALSYSRWVQLVAVIIIWNPETWLVHPIIRRRQTETATTEMNALPDNVAAIWIHR